MPKLQKMRRPTQARNLVKFSLVENFISQPHNFDQLTRLPPPSTTMGRTDKHTYTCRMSSGMAGKSSIRSGKGKHASIIYRVKSAAVPQVHRAAEDRDGTPPPPPPSPQPVPDETPPPPPPSPKPAPDEVQVIATLSAEELKTKNEKAVQASGNFFDWSKPSGHKNNPLVID